MKKYLITLFVLSFVIPVAFAQVTIQKYSKGMRILSISDYSELEFNDSEKEPYVMVFKRGSLVGYENGSLYFKGEDVLSINPNI